LSETLMIKNGVVITVDGKNKIYKNGTVVVRDGRILEVGKTVEVAKKYRADTVVDAKKKAVLPGFVNLHVHSGLIRGTAEDLAVWEWLKMYVDPKHKVLKSEDAYIASKLCYAEMLRAGVTCCLDMYRYMDRCADAAEEVGIRAFLSPYVGGAPGFDYFETLSENENLVRTRNGAANGRINVWFGLEHLVYCTEETYRAAGELARKYGVGIHTHGEESREMANKLTKKYGKRPTEVFNDYGILGPKTVLAHCVWLSDSEIKVIAKTGTNISHNPTANMKLASGVCRVLDLIKKGINVGLGSDGIKENNKIDIIQEMKNAALLQKVNSLDATVLPVNTVLRMATINGATALGLGNETGSLEKGKRADITIIDLNKLHMSPLLFDEFFNIVANIVYAAQGGDVSTVLVDGKVVVKDGRVQTVDEEKLIENHTKVAASVLERRKKHVPQD